MDPKIGKGLLFLDAGPPNRTGHRASRGVVLLVPMEKIGMPRRFSGPGFKLFDSMLWLNRAEKVGSSISGHSDHPSVLGRENCLFRGQ